MLSRNTQSRNQNRWHLAGLITGMMIACSSTAAKADDSQKRVPLRISKETTVITEPLKSNRKEVDYFRALEQLIYPKEMKTDQNGFRMIIRAIGPVQGKDPTDEVYREFHAQTYKKLGLDPSTKPTMTFEDPQKVIEAFTEMQAKKVNASKKDIDRVINMLNKKLESPWTLKEMPMMADWLKKNGPALDLIAKATKQPYLIYPKLRESEEEPLLAMLLPEAQRLRAFARALQTRANYRIAQGDLEAAIEDILACKALGHHAGHNGLLVDILIGIAIENTGTQMGISGNLKRQPTETQLQKLLDVLTGRSNLKLRDPVDFETAKLSEEYMMLDIIQIIANIEPHKRNQQNELLTTLEEVLEVDLLKSGFLNFTYDWNLVIGPVHDDFKKLPEFDTRQPKIDPSKMRASREYRSKLMNRILTLLLMANWEAYSEAINRNACHNQIQAITLAMLLYEKRHGTLPPAWTVDRTGKPLHSWRVLLLPYLGDEAKRLYHKIRLDEPWDSAHNRQFHNATIPFYQCPSAKLRSGQTAYTVVVGPKTAFRGNKDTKLDEFGPNSANLLLVTERKLPVCWMAPNLEVTESNAKTQVGSKHPEVVLAGFRGGNTFVVPSGIVEGKPSDREGKKLDPALFGKLLEGTAKEIP